MPLGTKIEHWILQTWSYRWVMSLYVGIGSPSKEERQMTSLYPHLTFYKNKTAKHSEDLLFILKTMVLLAR